MTNPQREAQCLHLDRRACARNALVKQGVLLRDCTRPCTYSTDLPALESREVSACSMLISAHPNVPPESLNASHQHGQHANIWQNRGLQRGVPMLATAATSLFQALEDRRPRTSGRRHNTCDTARTRPSNQLALSIALPRCILSLPLTGQLTLMQLSAFVEQC